MNNDDAQKSLYLEQIGIDVWYLREYICTYCHVIAVNNPQLILIDALAHNTHNTVANNALLYKMLLSIDINHENVMQIFICTANSYKCINFIKQQIKPITNQIILAFGDAVGQLLFKKSLQDLRSKVQNYMQYLCFFTYHPEFLLFNPQYKAQAYADLLLLKTYLIG